MRAAVHLTDWMHRFNIGHKLSGDEQTGDRIGSSSLWPTCYTTTRVPPTGTLPLTLTLTDLPQLRDDCT
jgi:hypothetical protein